MVKKGHYWEAICAQCDHAVVCVWQKKKPTHAAGACPWCLSPNNEWVHGYFDVKGVGRMSGFSTSESDFVPHFNRAFGKRVESLAEMKALQAKHGVEDAVVKGDGADRHAPRDLQRRLKGHREFREVMENGGTYTRDGVSVTFTEE